MNYIYISSEILISVSSNKSTRKPCQSYTIINIPWRKWRRQPTLRPVTCWGLCPDLEVIGVFVLPNPKQWILIYTSDLMMIIRQSNISPYDRWKQSWGCWFQTPSRPLRRHCDVMLNVADNYKDLPCGSHFRTHVTGKTCMAMEW